MPIKRLVILVLAILSSAQPVLSQETRHRQEHGGEIFKRFLLEVGSGMNDTDHGETDWHFDGWIGTDENKLWLKSEGKYTDSRIGESEFTALYSRYIDTFWDVQFGIRHDSRPSSLTYMVIGLEGLAPYFFETGAHGYISENGDISLRLRQENDLLITQRLVLQPYLETELFLQNVPERDTGRGLTHAELGLQLRYEHTRKFAPYVDVKYKRKFGRTASIAKDKGEDNDGMVVTVGLRLMF